MTRLIIPGGEIKIKGGDHAGAVIPFYNVSFNEDGRHPIFWGESEPDAGWLICDGGDDLNGGTVPNLSDRFIMGTTDAAQAKATGGSNTTGNTTVGGTVANASVGGSVGSTTLAVSQMPGHNHLTRWAACGAADPYAANSTYVSWPVGGTRMSSGAYSDATGGSGSHTHSFSGSSHSHGFSGASHNHSATPPYYKLVYCVKLPE